MSTQKDKKSDNSSLANFDLNDSETDWFGIGGTEANKTSMTKILGQIDEDFDNEDEATSTNLDDEDKKAKKKVDPPKEVQDTDFNFDGKAKRVETKPIVKPTVKKVIEEEEETEEEVKPKTKVATSKKEDEVEEAEGKDDKTEDENEDDADFYTSLADEFAEEGFFTSEGIVLPKENEVISKDQFFELVEDEVEARAAEVVEDFAKDMDDDGKAFIKFKRAGGNSIDFFQHYLSPIKLDEFDPKNKNQVDQILRFYVTTTEELTGDELEERIVDIKEGGKEVMQAEKWFGKLKDRDEKRKIAILAATEARSKEKEEDIKEFNNTIKETLEKIEKVGVFVFTKEDKRELTPYITKPTVKVGKNRFAPEMQVALAKILAPKSEKDLKDLLVLAKILKAKFDMAGIIQVIGTKVTKKVEETIDRRKREGKRVSSVGSSAKQSLADIFES